MGTQELVKQSGRALATLSASQELLRHFLSGRNPRTIRAYRADLEDFQAFEGSGELQTAAARLISLSPGSANARVLAYRANMIDRHLAPATVNRRLSALRALVSLAQTLGLVSWGLQVQSVKREPYRDTRGPGTTGCRLILAEAEKQAPVKAARDRALIRLLYDLGLRRGEVVGLELADLDLTSATVAVLGKGKSEKLRLTLPDQTRAALEAWLKVRGTAPGPLFTNFDHARKGNGLTGAALYYLIRRLGLQAGLEGIVRPHGLRHAAITEALRLTNGNIQAVQRFSRHRNADTVIRYDDSRRDMGGEIAKMLAASA